MLFYFTATGNSLYVAKKLDANPISIPQALHYDNLRFEDETIGIVCPIFAGEPPKIVMEFIKKVSFKTNYFYMVMTYGKDHSDAAEFTEKIGKECGVIIDYINTVLMVDNYLPVFDMDEELAIDKNVDAQIEAVKKEIESKTHKILVATEDGRRLHAMVAERHKQMPGFNNGEQITIKETCTGCGICSKVCPIGNFYLDSGKAFRRKSTCAFCLACAHNCPEKAITLSIMDRNPNARFRNEHVSLKEIIDANNQIRI